jgi:hypothetical protein
MTTFEDGPAKGQRLMLKRVAVFLRVVFDATSDKWDALDQLDDVPMNNEKVYAYTLVSCHGMCHINSRRGSGFYPISHYRLVAEQPPEIVMRHLNTWAQWAKQQPPRPDLEKIW